MISLFELPPGADSASNVREGAGRGVMLRICSARRRHRDSISAVCLDQILAVFISCLDASSRVASCLPWLGTQDALWRHRDGLYS